MEEDILSIVISEIEKYFHFLFERGFKIQSKTYYPQAFGDWEVVLGSPDCIIKVRTDRSEVMMSLGPNHGISKPVCSLEAAIYYLTDHAVLLDEYDGKFNNGAKQLERYVTPLRNYLSKIIELFGDDFDKDKAHLATAQHEVNKLYFERYKRRHSKS